MPPIVIALGSNLGDRAAHLSYAVSRLASHLEDLRVSSFIDTEPVGVAPQPAFLNGALTGRAEGSPREWLDRLLRIEAERGRQRPHLGAPRTLDLDLILFGDTVMDEPGLTLPHPRFRERFFVLEPIVEVAPSLVDPVTGLTMEELLEGLKRKQAERS